MPLIRPTTPEESSASANPGAKVIIRHPGYGDDSNALIILAGFDTDGEKEGLHFGTASTICTILTGRRDGYFTAGQDGSRVEVGFDGVLEKGTYYLHIPDDHQYPIYLSFEHWRFPHEDLPDAYAHTAPEASQSGYLSLALANLAGEVMIRDRRCILSRDRDVKERAHLCPRKEGEWFVNNHMQLYNQNQSLDPDDIIDDTANAIALRNELHWAFDQKFFVFLIKENTWTTHFIRPTLDMGRQYHNMPITLNRAVSTQFVYSRLAWAVFPMVRMFLVTGLRRWVLERVVKGDSFMWERKLMNIADIRSKFARTPSPTKRQRGDQAGRRGGNEAGCTDKSSDSTLSGSNAEQDSEDDDSFSRGRSKRRRGSYGSQSSYGGYGALSPIKTTPQTRPSSLAQSELSPTRLLSGQNSVTARVASEFELNQVPTAESAADDRQLDAHISKLRSQEVKRRRPKKGSLDCCHYQDAEYEVEYQDLRLLVEDEDGKEPEPAICAMCKGHQVAQTDKVEVTFGKGCRDEGRSIDDVHPIGLPRQEDTSAWNNGP